MRCLAAALCLLALSAGPARASKTPVPTNLAIGEADAVGPASGAGAGAPLTIGPLVRDNWQQSPASPSNNELLRRYPRSSLLAQRLGPDFIPIAWSGEYRKLPERNAAIRNIVQFVENEYSEDHDRPINAVCQRRGCAVALEAFDELNAKGIKINKFVSISPRIAAVLWEKKPGRPANVREWIDFFSEEASPREGKGIAGYCVAPPDRGEAKAPDIFTSELREAVLEMIRSEGSGREVLSRGKYRKAFSFGSCPGHDAAPALEEAAARSAAPAAQAPPEKESLAGPRRLILGAIELARKLTRQTRIRVENMRLRKQLKKEDLLAQKREEDERRRQQQQQQAFADQSAWDPGQAAWPPQAGGAGAPGASAAATAAGAVYGMPSATGAGHLSGFPQGGVRLQDLQPQQPQGGPLDPTSP